MRATRGVLILALIAALVIPLAGLTPAHGATKRCVAVETVVLLTGSCRVFIPPGPAGIVAKWNVPNSGGWDVLVENDVVAASYFGNGPSGSIAIPACSCNLLLRIDGRGRLPALGLLQVSN